MPLRTSWDCASGARVPLTTRSGGRGSIKGVIVTWKGYYDERMKLYAEDRLES